jgi:hypothetical protein
MIFSGQLKSDSLGNACAAIHDSEEHFFCRLRARLSFHTAKTLFDPHRRVFAAVQLPQRRHRRANNLEQTEAIGPNFKKT